MLKIRLLKDRQVVGTIDAKWTIDITDIATSADELEPESDADDWEVVNEAGGAVLTKARWEAMRR